MPLAVRALLLTLVLAVAAPLHATAGIGFDTDFEGANLAAWSEVEPGVFDLSIARDAQTSTWRWYSFRVTGAAGREITLRIPDANRANAPQAWSFNKPVASSDGGGTWTRVMDTDYSGGVFSWTHTPESDSEWYALVPPYSFQRWLDLLDSIADDPRVAMKVVIGESLDGRPVHLLVLASHGQAPTDRPGIWITSRVHPAETGSSWQLEGFLEWALSDDAEAARLLEHATICIVGVLNPDGVVRGYNRLDTLGQNLNREWNNDDPARAPTIIATRNAMRNFIAMGGEILSFQDLHSHSSIRANFSFWNDESAGMSAEEADDQRAFLALFEEINPDFSAARSPGGSATSTGIAKNWAWRELGIVHSHTFESSYQDITHGPRGFMDIPRYKALGEDLGRALVRHFFPEDGVDAVPMGVAE